MKRYRCNFDFSKGVWVQGCFVPGLEVMEEPVLSPLPETPDGLIDYIMREKRRVDMEDGMRLDALFFSYERWSLFVDHLASRRDCVIIGVLFPLNEPISVWGVKIQYDPLLRKDEVRGVFE